MHPIDQAIFDEQEPTVEMLVRAGREPLPPEGSSYWGDAMRELFAECPDDVAPGRAWAAVTMAREAMRKQQEKMTG